ncbi:unnamed protein product [Microthlaspi erraticum]|uniref:BAH domain-containing protein n=1 Tax=Microthlaspi erraticum TaxID=1685480 RepID=A0A6D2I0G1_9BRAS|nr:unnamed protein product [Microthlaspi erraticum]
MERTQIKRKMERSAGKMHVKKKRELESKPEDSPQPIGELVKFPGRYPTTNAFIPKRHYEKFHFHGKTYALEDTVLLTPKGANKKPYVAIIKDIYLYIRDKEESLKLQVQWFYRPEDLDKKYVRHWKSKDARELLYSLHRDEVIAESVMNICSVYFAPEGKQIPNHGEYPDFFVTWFYDCYIKKICKLCDIIFDDDEQQQELDLLVAKTISQAGDLLDIEKKKKLRRKSRLIKSHELVDQIKDGLSVDEGTANNEETIGSTSESVNSDSYLNDF